jgi:PAS domain S-box-containing protein
MSLQNASYTDQLNELMEPGEGNQRFQQGIYDFFPSLICVYDISESKLRYVNKKITDVLGFSQEDLKAWGYDFTKVVFKDDLDSVLIELDKFSELKDEDSHAYKCRFNCKEEGTWRHFHVTGKVLKRNEHGKAASLLFIAQDVTERIQSLEEAKSSKELINETEDLLNFGTWTWSIKNGEMVWSTGMYSLLSCEKKDLPKPSTDFYINHIAEEDREEFKAALAKAVEHKTLFEKEYFIIDSRGDDKRVYSKGKLILNENGEPIKMLGITRCITEHSQLHASLSNYKQMALEKEEFLGHGSWELNHVDKSIQWSDGMYRLFGYDPEKDRDSLRIDEQLYKNHLLEDDYNQGVTLQVEKLNNSNSYVWEYEIKTKNGESRKLETFGKIIRDRKGKPTRIIGTTRDITQLRNYERELERTITELKRSNKDLEDFAYIASHDIQEPLRKITSFSERLKTKYSKDLDDEAKKYLERIMVATKNARLLIDGLMDFSRLTNDGQLFVKLDLNTLLQEIRTELELKIEETETIIKTLPLPVIEAVPVQIRQLFTNLLLNAIKFKKQGVSPLIEIKSRRLSRNENESLNLNPLKTYYKITVEDNGIGFEDEYAQKIFEMFQRLHSKAEYPGAGIGLALCKKITENHGGVIFANSELDKGTTFSVILPEMQY